MHPKLQFKLEKAAKSQYRMMKEITNENHEVISFNPDATSWSILEVVEHCVNIENAVLFNLIKYKDYPTKSAGWKETLRYAILKMAMTIGMRFKVPPVKDLTPSGGFSAEEVKKRWNDTRNSLINYLKTFPAEKMHDTVFKHPRAGYITILQTVDFINDHTLHHMNQISRIRKQFNKQKK